jgi:hypothetical protein
MIQELSGYDIYVAVVVTIGVLLTAAGVYFTAAVWRHQGRRPRLALGVRDTVRSNENANEPVRDVSWEFEVTNAGRVAARAWRLQLEPPAGPIRSVNGQAGSRYDEHEWYFDNQLHRILEWSASSDADVVVAAQPAVIPCTAQLPEDDTLTCRYTLAADRAKTRQGSVTIRHVDGQPVVELGV